MPDGPHQTEQPGQESDLTTDDGAFADVDLNLDISTPPEPLDEAEVEALLSTLSKTLRAFQIYKLNNPVLQRFLETLSEGFRHLWRNTDVLRITVAEDGLRWGGRLFTVGAGRDNIAFMFYKDGIRYLTFLPGFEDEIGTFLDVLNRARHLDQTAEDDLITLLWERDFGSFQYGYVDQLGEGLALPQAGGDGVPPIPAAALQQEAAAEEAPAQAQTVSTALVDDEEPVEMLTSVSREDFEETLYFLDAAEMESLQAEVRRETRRDLRTAVLRALFDRLEDSHAGRQREILGILDQLLPIFLSRGHLESAASVLRELEGMMAGNVLDAELVDQVDALFDRLSDESVLNQFVEVMAEGDLAPDSESLSLFFGRLRPRALPTLIRLAGSVEDEEVHKRLGSAIDGLARENPGELLGLFELADPVVVRGAAEAAGRLKMTDAVAPLRDALSHADPGVRLAVAEALLAIRSAAALTALIEALEDPDREVRVAVVRGLGSVRFASARDRLARITEGRALRDADLTEKIAFFEAYGAIAGASAVPALSEMLNYKGLLGRRNPNELRACAALALGKVGNDEARAALNEASDDPDPVVRNAVLGALRAGRENDA
ncbi:MAG TPA: HEAT repeat domain-containing protein [Longimicrobiales bacterium]|nr:HEAT repeat domain-containing protein [Longimicrobiales bacterium]